jgi:peptidyl-prolyl cis-trans isomerase SDCCAG10
MAWCLVKEAQGQLRLYFYLVDTVETADTRFTVQGLQPDGIADHHKMVNETTFNDQSKSEFWSSFSSSEEKLLNCAGLILNLPLTPHSKCSEHQPHREYAVAALENTITYK